jgi:hypothetical protein
MNTSRHDSNDTFRLTSVSCQNEDNDMSAKLSNTIIEAAIYGFEAQKRALDTQIADLRAMLNGTAQTASAEVAAPRRKLSASARKKMADAQRRRWAALKGQSAAEAPAAEPKKAKRKMSAAGKAAIAAATKKRWAAFRAAKAGKK